MTFRVLTFDGTDPRHGHYHRMIGDALTSRGAQNSQGQAEKTVSKTDRKAEAKIREQWTAISVVDDERIAKVHKERERLRMEPLDLDEPDDPLAPDPRPRKLSPSGGVIRLEASDFNLLTGYVEGTPWTESYSRLFEALESWLSGAEKEDTDEREPAKPVAVPRRAKG